MNDEIFDKTNDVLRNNFLKIELQECLQVSDFPNVCRVCLSPSRLHSIFKFKDELFRTPQDLSSKMRKCSKIKAKRGDGLPDKICEGCISILKLALHFRTLSENTNRRLREALKREKKLSEGNTLRIDLPHVEKKLKKIDRRKLDLLKEFPLNEKSDESSEIDDIKREIKTECETDPCNVKSEEQHSPFNHISEECKLGECGGDTLGMKDGDPEVDLTYYGCLVCGGERRFPSRDSLVAHMALQHGKHVDYRCHGCDQVFDTRRLRLQHEKKDCPKMPPGSHYMCRKCPAELRTRPALEVHLAQHEGGTPSTVELGALHACPVCRKTLSNKGSLCTHMRLVHMQTPAIPCPICNKTMKSEYSLHSHMRTHAEPLHACGQCAYRTNLRQSLVLHMRRHSGERPYACEWCAHRSVNISNLNKHHLIHTGVRKHECAECGKKYKAKKTLVSHISSFHRGLRPFCCDKCGNKYARHKTMRAHQKKAHPDD